MFRWSALLGLLTFLNYGRLTGTENIRPIHIVTLLTGGMMLGIFVFTGIWLWKGPTK